MCRSPTRRRISSIPATHGHRRSKSSPPADLPEDAGETIAPPAEFREEPARFGLGKPTLLGDEVRHPFGGDRFASPSAGHHRIDPAGPPFDDSEPHSQGKNNNRAAERRVLRRSAAGQSV